MLVDATVHQEDQATYLSEDVCVDYDGYKKGTGNVYKGPHMYLSSNLPYCMILICDIQIVGLLVLIRRYICMESIENSSGNGEDAICQWGEEM